MTRDSFIVSLYGLDGKREHWMPGNRRRGTPAREKRGFPTEEAAREFCAERGWFDNPVYKCSICGEYHTASPERT